MSRAADRFYSIPWLTSSDQVYCAMLAAGRGYPGLAESALFCRDLSFSRPASVRNRFDFEQRKPQAFFSVFPVEEEGVATVEPNSIIPFLAGKIEQFGPILVQMNFGRSEGFRIDARFGSEELTHFTCLTRAGEEVFEFSDFKGVMGNPGNEPLSETSFSIPTSEALPLFADGFTIRYSRSGFDASDPPGYLEVVDDFLTVECDRFSDKDHEEITAINRMMNEPGRGEIGLPNGLGPAGYAAWLANQRAAVFGFHSVKLNGTLLGDGPRRNRCLELLTTRITSGNRLARLASLSVARGTRALADRLLDDFVEMLSEDLELKEAFMSWRRTV